MILTANKLGMSGLALTDHECLCGHIEFLREEKDLKKRGLISQDFKCGLGNEIYLVEDRHNIERYWHYILIAKNNMGHRALRELSSIAWYNGFNSKGMMRVPTEMKELEEIVKKYPNSLISTIGCIGGFISSHIVQLAKEEEKDILDEEKIYSLKKQINDFVKWNINLFGDDFYFEIAAGTAKDQKLLNHRIKSIAKAYNRKIVIGSDSHFLTSKERPIHKAYLNSKEGEREVDEFYWNAHMMDNEEAFENLKEFYSEEEFIEICNNSMEIYNKIEGYNLHHNPIIPEVEVKNYPKKDKKIEFAPTLTKLFISDNIQERAWVNMCWDSLAEKGLSKKDNYVKRLEEEANIIYELGLKIGDCLYKYFNTFQHYIDLFWDCGSIVGPGRGSSGAFLSNYLLGITQADPIIFGFPEWRFLNREKVELPK